MRGLALEARHIRVELLLFNNLIDKKMKTKVWEHSRRGTDRAVAKYRELEKINDDVYTFVEHKCNRDEDNDELGLVYKIGNVYYKERTINRYMLKKYDIGGVGSEWVRNFRPNMEHAMRSGYVPRIVIYVFRLLGW